MLTTVTLYVRSENLTVFACKRISCIPFTVRATSLPLQKCLHRLMSCLYLSKIANYLSNTGKEKKDLYYVL